MSGAAHQASTLARALLAPRSVAIVGASSDPTKNTGRPQRFLARHGYRGQVHPVNPAREQVQGVPAFSSVRDVPGPVDHALIMVPRERVAAAIEDCAAHDVPVVTVYSDGFADLGTDEGLARQQALLACARRVGVRMVGPNSMGVLNFHAGLTLSVNAILEMDGIVPGPVSVISQSGSILGSLLSRGTARGFGFSKMVSVGNEADLGVGEILELLIDDPQTRSIALFLESLRGADAMAAAARRAYREGKPVVAYKLGRSALGRRLAATHSGAMTGDAQVADSFFEANGIARVSQFETLLEVIPLLRAGAARRRPRVSVMTTTGGGAATVVDRLGEMSIETVPASDAVAGMLKGHGVDVAGKAITDLTMAGARREIFQATLAGMLEDEDSDAVVVVVGSSGQFHPHLTVEPIVECAGAGRPIAVYVVPDAPASLRLLADAGVAAFRTPEGCADGIRSLLTWSPPLPRPAASVDVRVVSRAVEEAVAGGQAGAGGMHEAGCYPILCALGIPVAPFAVLGPVPEEGEDGEGGELPCLQFPVALKLLSAGLSHKSDVGGVALGIADAGQLTRRMRAMTQRVRHAAPGLRLDGWLVQSMQRGVGEAVLAFRRDPEAGPLVSVGLGGVLTEIYRDIAVRMAPVGLDTARAMIAEVKGLAVLRGFRGAPEGDLEALAQCIVRLSQLAQLGEPVLLEAEINPLIVRERGRGVVAVDAVMVPERRS